jgi:hypothetical protein
MEMATAAAATAPDAAEAVSETPVSTVTVVELVRLKGAANTIVIKHATVASRRKYANGFESQTLQSFEFKPPCAESCLSISTKVENRVQLTTNGLVWGNGTIPHADHKVILYNACKGEGNHTIYARGAINCAYLGDILKKTVINLDFPEIPKLKSW